MNDMMINGGKPPLALNKLFIAIRFNSTAV
jgi:hypothetical protein